MAQLYSPCKMWLGCLICGLGANNDAIVSISKSQSICALNPVALDPIFRMLAERFGAHGLDSVRDMLARVHMVHVEAYNRPVKALDTLWGNSGAVCALSPWEMLAEGTLEIHPPCDCATHIEDVTANSNMSDVDFALVFVGMKRHEEGRVHRVILRGQKAGLLGLACCVRLDMRCTGSGHFLGGHFFATGWRWRRRDCFRGDHHAAQPSESPSTY